VRRNVLLVALAVVAALVVGILAERGSGGAPRGPDVAPVLAARRARDAAAAEPLIVTLVAFDGAEVARARLDGARAELSAGGLTGVQEGNRLYGSGVTVEVPAPDAARLLAPLVDRPARWEGRHLRLDGRPAARAWLDAQGRLARLEMELDGGGLLVVTPDR